jgi:enediyne polyketide synthase
VACDVETAAARPAEAWADLLGPHAPLARLIAAETGEGTDTAGTRVWAAIECQRKAGLPADAPLTLTSAGPGPWVVLSSGGPRIAILATTLRDAPAPVVFAVLSEGGV